MGLICFLKRLKHIYSWQGCTKLKGIHKRQKQMESQIQFREKSSCNYLVKFNHLNRRTSSDWNSSEQPLDSLQHRRESADNTGRVRMSSSGPGPGPGPWPCSLSPYCLQIRGDATGSPKAIHRILALCRGVRCHVSSKHCIRHHQ